MTNLFTGELVRMILIQMGKLKMDMLIALVYHYLHDIYKLQHIGRDRCHFEAATTQLLCHGHIAHHFAEQCLFIHGGVLVAGETQV